jgi:apolipoprotein N-acyltransferase
MKTVLAVAATGAMWFASFGTNHVWPLAWVAMVPLLAVVPDRRPLAAAVAAFAAAALGWTNLVFTYSGAMPVPLLAAFVALTAAPYGVIVVVWRAIERRVTAPVGVLAYAALTVAVEFVMSSGSPNGTFGSIAYSQTDVLPLMQTVSITGLWGLVFVISLVNAAIALAWRKRRAGAVLPPLLTAAVPLIAILVFGITRLAAGSPPLHVRVGLAADDAAVPAVAATTADAAMPIIMAYAERTAQLAARGAQVVVLPEKFVGVRPEYAAAARDVLSRAARNHHVTIVAGFNEVPHNRAVVFDTDGRIVQEYDKVHLVPGLESQYRPGTNIGLFDMSGVLSGVAICKDLDFSSLGRAYGNAGVGLLLVPAWDFVRDGWVHSRMAIMRAVENGYALARTASQGRLTVTDARGRIIAEAVSADASEVLVTAAVPVAPGGTFYSRTGDWFAWVCVIIATACGLTTGIRARRAGSASRRAEAPTPGRWPALRD